ncbi:CBN-MDT-11 protein [Caenorhabditis brenneri]|uniref:Mediator of RNA polymerase II transcription subunit 11 n=1 Tax=Caenorhabditis brenneri TaxID=135651 RepID=G0MEN6_CAEBE|nr:CBN-MDT-11 protein [Caenorhabditis brenneri]
METNSNDPILSDRIQAIVSTEKSIDDMMKCAREIIQDLQKEKQIGKNKMEDNANTFKKLITQVENELSAQMQYLSHVCVGSAHQGSSFGALQNSLLSQSGVASLHSELATILTSIDPQPESVIMDEAEAEEDESSENVDEVTEDEVAPLTISSTGTSSERDSGAAPEDDARSSSAPRSQEETNKRETLDGEEEEQMDQ